LAVDGILAVDKESAVKIALQYSKEAKNGRREAHFTVFLWESK
jgi:hypothetical protein